tara:strand:- start:557 stop:1492 length:936 start_codon:yes stop_codon:yes gene_type:complete
MNILITGGTGLVGKALESIKSQYPLYNFIFLSSKDADLTKIEDTRNKFKEIQPKMVIHLAACVGGLFKNMNNKVDMYEKNILINLNVLKVCHELRVTKLVSCLSTCIFPNKISYPIDESVLHNGPPHDSNDAYAYAKRMMEIHSKAYQEQYNNNFICIIPTNIYGEHDNYSLEDGHVIPSLIHKCFLAKKNKEKFTVLGTGIPLRQFIYSKDLAELIMWSLLKYEERSSIILSVDKEDEISIAQVAYLIAKNFNYEDNIIYDTSRSDGQLKKTANNSFFRSLNPDYEFTNINVGLKNSINWFVNNYPNCRH